MLHLHIYIFSTFSFRSSLSFYYPFSFIQPCSCNFYLLAVILHQYTCFNVSFQLSSQHHYIPLSLSFLLLTPHTSYIFITLCFYLHLSNLLLYALGPSVVWLNSCNHLQPISEESLGVGEFDAHNSVLFLGAQVDQITTCIKSQVKGWLQQPRMLELQLRWRYKNLSRK